MNKGEEIKTKGTTALREEVIRVGKNSLIYVVGQALSRMVGFLMIPVYTRYISPGNYGAMDLIEITASAIGILISMGVVESMSRFYYAEKDDGKRNQIVNTIIKGFGTIGLIFVLLTVAFSGHLSGLMFEEPKFGFYLKVSIITVWFSMFCEIGYSYLRMLYMAKLFVVITSVQLVLALSLNIYFIVFLKLDILGIFYSSLITQGLTGTILAIAILRKTRSQFSIQLLGRIIKFGLPLAPMRLGSLLGFSSNRFFLLYMSPLEPAAALVQVGLFSLGHKFGVIINRFVNAPFNSFWVPRRMELLLNNEAQAKETVARICTYSLILSLYMALMLSAGIESVVIIMADSAYYGAYYVVPFVALTYVILGLEMHFSTGILYMRKTPLITYSSLLAVIVVLVWNYIFVPIYGIFGAATANLAGFAVRTSIIYILSQRLYSIPFEKKRIAHLFVTAAILYLVSQTINFSSVYVTFFARTSFVALFPVFLFFTGFYHEGELEYLGRFFRNIRPKGKRLDEEGPAYDKQSDL